MMAWPIGSRRGQASSFNQISRYALCVLCGLIICSSLFVGAGCSDRSHYANEISPGLMYISRLYTSGRYTTVHADLNQIRCQFHWKDDNGNPFGTIAALPEFDFATNGSIYEPGQIPTGLYIESGETLIPLNLDQGKGNFFLRPNGVFAIGSAGATIVDAAEYEPETAESEFAVQSGPLLVKNGKIHPAFNADSDNRYIRSGVGVQSPNRIVFALSKEPVTFHEFATFFRESVGCENALYLDGAISTFAYRDSEPPAQPTPYATMITLIASVE